MKRILFIFLAAFISFVATGNDLGKLIGTWNYTASYAPPGYDKGQLVFFDKDGITTGQVKISGYATDIKNLKFSEGVYSFTVTVEYQDIPVSFKLEGDKLTGKASSPEGDLPIEAKKVTEPKE
ncbi:hypothetical protein BA6E_125486 [Bacteroidales bacterium 6E]|nr:hypothetical protein BA6E_125486 [Bacteroidales bacterium 6E]